MNGGGYSCRNYSDRKLNGCDRLCTSPPSPSSQSSSLTGVRNAAADAVWASAQEACALLQARVH
jgi:hypothetical protein